MKHYSMCLACLSFFLPAQRSAAATYQVKTVLPGMQSQAPVVPVTLMPSALMPTSAGPSVLTPTMNLSKDRTPKVLPAAAQAASPWQRLVAAGQALTASDPQLSASDRVDDALTQLFDDSAAHPPATEVGEPRHKRMFFDKLPKYPKIDNDMGDVSRAEKRPSQVAGALANQSSNQEAGGDVRTHEDSSILSPVDAGVAHKHKGPFQRGPFQKIGKIDKDAGDAAAANLSEADKRELGLDVSQPARRSWLIDAIVRDHLLDDVFSLVRDMSSKKTLFLKNENPGSGDVGVFFEYSGEKGKKPAPNDYARIEMKSLVAHKNASFSVNLSPRGFRDTEIVRVELDKLRLTVVLKNKNSDLPDYMKMVVTFDPSYGIASMSISNGTYLMMENFWKTLSVRFDDRISGQ